MLWDFVRFFLGLIRIGWSLAMFFFFPRFSWDFVRVMWDCVRVVWHVLRAACATAGGWSISLIFFCGILLRLCGILLGLCGNVLGLCGMF